MISRSMYLPVIEVGNFLDLLKINIETIPSDPYKGIALLGDFNDRCQTWNDNHGKSELKRQLVDLIYSSNFEQIISLPTGCENILDLCITNMPRYILDSVVDVPPDPALDHSLIWVIFFMTSPKKSQLKQVKIPHKRKLRTGKSSDHDLYNEARRKVKHEINLSKKDHEENVYNRLINPEFANKQYWKLVKTYLPGNVSSSSINLHDPMTNDQIISEEEKANLLNNFFVQSTCLPAQSPKHSLPGLI